MFYTQLEAAKKGFVTDAMKIVAEKEQVPVERIRELVSLGQVVIPCNKNHTCIDPEGIGKALRTKINVNLGTSRDVTDYDSEIEKVNWAIQLGAESIMDLSTHGDTRIFRRKLTGECKAMIGTVPVYDSVIHHKRDLAELTAQDFLDTIRLHAEDGVDFVTLHCGITRQTIITIAKDLGYDVIERRITRDEFYIADEAFFTGTAAEVTPIREYDDRQIGEGVRGPITTQIQKAYFDAVQGKDPKYAHWLTYVK